MADISDRASVETAVSTITNKLGPIDILINNVGTGKFVKFLELDPEAREIIKGHKVKYYLDLINEVREKTIEELKKKDDKWLMADYPLWSKDRQINTYWKWFHVCEHGSNHRGQVTWLKSRLPGTKSGNDES
jgi:NAD(P)-dependent dehydrogenase (short-subunit alcohol dehydrogenase family)